MVDDEPVNVQALVNFLTLAKYDVVTAADGQEALDLLAGERACDIVLLDVMMPKLSGFDVCQRIRERYSPAELPIILLTAKNRVSDLVMGFGVGANDYLTKPFASDELLARVSVHLELAKISDSYSRFVPRQFLEQLGKERIVDVALGDQVQREMTVLFSDIRNFTQMSEGMSPAETFKFVNQYLGAMEPAISGHSGVIDKFVGDAVMALFPRRADDAVQGALDMIRRLEAWNAQRVDRSEPPVKIGIGLHTGSLMLGTVGARDRMDTTVISDAVNLASRVESLTKTYCVPLIITEATFLALNNPAAFRFAGSTRFSFRENRSLSCSTRCWTPATRQPARRNCAHWRTSKRASRFTRPGTSRAPSAIWSEPWLAIHRTQLSRFCLNVLAVSPGRRKHDHELEKCGHRRHHCVLPGLMSAPAKAQASDAAKYVEVEICAGCHQTQAERWKTSHHALAMEKATPATVLGDFSGVLVENFGVVSTFSRVGDKFMVRTDGPDGALHDYEITHTFGVDPLQQYLIGFPDGRYQVLGLAWDTRPKDKGGQRWFHLYPDEKLQPGSPLHWTGRDQNWNYQCADCHTTDLKKNFDLAANTFATTWASLGVTCEACHGPGSRHVAWAKTVPSPPSADKPGLSDKARMGLEAWVKATDRGWWEMNPATGTARRTEPLASTQLDTCASCHSRRHLLAKGLAPDAPFLDAARRVSWCLDNTTRTGRSTARCSSTTSSLQSAMHKAGVVCSNCHEPHAAKLRAEGNASVFTVPSAGEIRRHRASQAFIWKHWRSVRQLPHANQDPIWWSTTAAITACGFRGPIFQSRSAPPTPAPSVTPTARRNGRRKRLQNGIRTVARRCRITPPHFMPAELAPWMQNANWID